MKTLQKNSSKERKNIYRLFESPNNFYLLILYALYIMFTRLPVKAPVDTIVSDWFLTLNTVLLSRRFKSWKYAIRFVNRIWLSASIISSGGLEVLLSDAQGKLHNIYIEFGSQRFFVFQWQDIHFFFTKIFFLSHSWSWLVTCNQSTTSRKIPIFVLE